MNAIASSTELFCLVNNRPIVTSIKDIARTSPVDNIIQLPSYSRDGHFCWSDTIAMQQIEQARGLHIVCEDGTWIACVQESQLLLVRSGEVIYTAAKSVSIGDSLLQLRCFQIPTVVDSVGMDEPLGEFIGWYVAEGNVIDAEDGIQLSMSSDEQEQAHRLIALIQQRFGIVGRIHIYERSLALIFSSRFIVALVRRFVRGHDAKTKRLSREAFFYGKGFLHGILSGYLQGDGHWDSNNQRWRLGLCRNEGLITDLGVIARILGYRLRFNHAFVPYQRKQAAIIRGTIRANVNAEWSYVSFSDLGLPARRFFSPQQRYSIANLRNTYKLITRKNPSAVMPEIAEQTLYGHVQLTKVHAIYPGPLVNHYTVTTNTTFANANGLLINK